MKSREIWGIILILVGVIFALKNIFGIDLKINFDWKQIWPILVILWGLKILLKKS